MVRDIPYNFINHSIPLGEAERESLSGRPAALAGRCQQSAAFRCAINNRDVSSHSSAVTRSTFWRNTAASCRVTRITAVTFSLSFIHSLSLSLSLSSLTLPPPLTFSSLLYLLSVCIDSMHRPNDYHCSMPSYIVKSCQLNYRQTSYAGRLSLSRAISRVPVRVKSRTVQFCNWRLSEGIGIDWSK